MNYYAESFINMNLDKNIPDELFTPFWGKIFYLIADYLIHSAGSKCEIILFYELSK